MRQAAENSIDCVYTIISPERLIQAARDNKPLHERTRWVTAERLVLHGRRLAVIFADARECSKLLAWSMLTDVKVIEGGTKFSVAELYGLGSLNRRKLTVASTGEPIPDGHIRPYVLCKVPKLLKALAKRPVPWSG
jgi:hypothetical protein